MTIFTVLGGSSIATPELVSSLLPIVHSGRRLQVVLHGRGAAKLEVVGRVCRQMAASTSGMSVRYTTDLADALSGADVILNQVRVGGLDARAYDETFPHRWDIPGEETVGAGGAANALRSVPVVLALCREIERCAPSATLITFSNPSSVVQRAILQATRLRKVIGLCDAPWTMHQLIAKALHLPAEQVDVQYIGMHHFGFITSARVNDEERLPDVLREVTAALGIDADLGETFGVLLHPYFRYFFHPDRMLKKQQSAAQPRARELQALEAELLAIYAAHTGSEKPEAVKRRSAVWYEAVVAPTVAALAYGDKAALAVNVVNDDVLPNLPADSIIEATADLGSAIRVRPPRALPPAPLLGMLAANADYEAALVDAILSESQAKLTAVLTTNPLVPSYDAAREIAAEIWARR